MVLTGKVYNDDPISMYMQETVIVDVAGSDVMIMCNHMEKLGAVQVGD